MKTKIFIVDDHDLIRDGLKALLEFEDKIEIAGEVADCDQLNKLLEIEIPDIILLDIGLPKKSGIEITEELSKKYPAIRVIILSGNMDEDSIFNAIKAGVKGYLPKSAKKSELVAAIKQVSEGGEYYSDSISTKIFRNYVKFAKVGRKHTIEKEVKLSEREIEIVKHFAEGLSFKEIAAKMFISARTVESHKNNILEKLELKTIIDLVKYAIRNDLIQL